MPGSPDSVPAPIPVVDLSAELSVEQITAACSEFGCFNIAGGPVSRNLTRKLLAQMELFFGLSDDDPVKIAAHRKNNAGANGWTPLLDEPAYEPDTVAWVESFDCVLSRDRLARLPEDQSRGIRPSIWPPLEEFRDVVRAHWDALIEAGDVLFPLISRMLGQGDDFLAERATSQALNTMRLLHYPRNQAVSDSVNKGIAAHTDFEVITFIHQTAPGLEVRSPAGVWQQVPVRPDQWTVLLGDMVERWSNGSIPATPHRVPNTPWPRFSVVMFMAADAGLEVRPLECFLGDGRPALFEPVTQDHLIDEAMARAEANRQRMLPRVEEIRAQLRAEREPAVPSPD